MFLSCWQKDVVFVDKTKTGGEIKLQRLLDAKEKRSLTQQRLINTFGLTLVCLLVNYVGQTKSNANTKIVFNEGVKQILKLLPVDYFAVNLFETGEEGFFVTKTPAKTAKRILCEVEQSHPLGRFMDIDVFDVDGKQIGREELGISPRKCLLCDFDARECYILRRHSTQELKDFTDAKIEKFALQSNGLS